VIISTILINKSRLDNLSVHVYDRAMKKYIFSVLVIVVLTAFAFTPAWENIYGYFGMQ
jgi:hypothetical protein